MNTKYEQILKDITEAQKLINSKRPFGTQQLPQLKKFYRTESTWSSNAIEGNTISLRETELVDWSNSVKNELHPVERAAEFNRKSVYIHPFPDGNGRVARLIMNMILLQEHYMPVLISPKIQSTYIKKLEDGRSFPTDFDEFIAKQEAKQQARFIKLLGKIFT